jgi:predicted HTH transcriptional regulator
MDQADLRYPLAWLRGFPSLREKKAQGAGGFVPNVACLLLFANDPSGKFPGCRIRFRRSEGEQEQTGANYNAVKDHWIEGSLPSIIEVPHRYLNHRFGSSQNWVRTGISTLHQSIPTMRGLKQ